MSNYVENKYSEGYVEGDSSSSTSSPQVVNVDLSSLVEKLDFLISQNSNLNDALTLANNNIHDLRAEILFVRQQNVDLDTKSDLILDKISSNKTLILSNSAKLVTAQASLDSSVEGFDFSTLVTKEYIDASVPFVDDLSVKIYRQGTKVHVTGYSEIGTVVSSHFIPSDTFQFTVVYSVEFMIDGVVNVSNFLAQQVVPNVIS